MPDIWQVCLQIAGREDDADADEIVLFRIHLETLSIEVADDPDDNFYHPMYLRVVVLHDRQANFVNIAVRDVPATIRAVNLTTPLGEHAVTRENASDDFDFECPLTTFTACLDEATAKETLISWLRLGTVKLSFIADPASHLRVEALLEEAGAIERDFDYELPSGLHSDTHINAGKLCYSETAITRMAAAFDSLFKDVPFDTIVTNGWAMSTIARRISDRRSLGSPTRIIQDVVCEDSASPSLCVDLFPENRVLILTDVVVTGAQLRRIRAIVERTGATVVGAGAIALAEPIRATGPLSFKPLLHLQMTIWDPADGLPEMMTSREKRVFNPVSGTMTRRAPQARSPSEFLEYDANALQFWEYIEKTGALEQHRREGSTHYLAFVNMQRLLTDNVLAEELVHRLRLRVREQLERPDIVLVPGRPRSLLFARLLVDSFRHDGGLSIELVVARRVRRKGTQRFAPSTWVIPQEHRRQLRGKQVLLVDAAVGHGTTVDGLGRQVAALGPSLLCVAVLLSRLSEGCEAAFNARLSGGFASLFRLPIPPRIIRGEDPSMCPVCSRIRAIREVARASGVEAVQRWAEHLGQGFRRRDAVQGSSASGEVQLPLFPGGDHFLQRCHSAVASGVTLHALNAAMTNGMAPLKLPELFNSRIPSRNRAGIALHLPEAALTWSGECLRSDLTRFLRDHQGPRVWAAVAELLARTGSWQWLEYLPELLRKTRRSKQRKLASFFNHLACSAVLTKAMHPEHEGIMRVRLEALLREPENVPYHEGLQCILDTLGRGA
jgi:orotate phosphoribosyltransferase/hypoxanthine phosphoribosyltransferase